MPVRAAEDPALLRLSQAVVVHPQLALEAGRQLRHLGSSRVFDPHLLPMLDS